MQKRNIFLWVLYDFANSFVIIAFALYFSQWLVIDAGLSSFWFNSIFVGSTLLLILSAPLTASIADKIKKRKIFLIFLTIGAVISFTAAATFAYFGPAHLLGAALSGLAAQYFYQFCFVFYNPMIEDLAPAEKRGKISGIGDTANWIGQIAGVLVALQFLKYGRAVTLFPAVAIYLLLALPMLIFYKEPHKTVKEKLDLEEIKSDTHGFIDRSWKFIKYSPAAIFILAFFFFNDAILTLQNNFVVFVDKTFSFDDKVVALLAILILLTAAIGAFTSGWLGDKIGMKKVMKIILACWVVVIPIVSFTTSKTFFFVITAVVGLLYGAVWPVARAYLSNALPEDQMNFGFSIYTLFERFSTLLGPLTWGIIVSLNGESAFGYRMAALSMTIFVIIGYFLVRRIPAV